MEKTGQSIANTLKEISSISEIAEKFGISRPTLYKYMDCFDNGEYDRIPGKILSYFDAMSREADPDRSTIYLMAETRRRHGIEDVDAATIDGEIEQRRKAIVHDSIRPRLDLSWYEDPVPSICVPVPGGACVFFKEAIERPFGAAVEVSIIVSGEPTVIGRFPAYPGMGFVNIRDLPRGPEYEYRVELSGDRETVLSDAHPLVMR